MTASLDQPQYDKGDVSFALLSGFLILIMIPGLALLYAGLVRRKNALHILFCCLLTNTAVAITWYVWGFSLAFSTTAKNSFIGNLSNAGLRDTLGGASTGSPLIPQLLYSFLQMEFACVTVAILIGALAERGRIAPVMLFSFVWTTLVYCPLAYWVWAPEGWAFKWGVLDFSGGGPVEIGSGVGGFAYALMLGNRKESQMINFRVYNVSFICLGTFLLWVGWLGFNAVSAFGANLRAVYAAWNTTICAATGGVVWCMLDYPKERKYSVVSFCSGTIAGLIVATSVSGFVPVWGALLLGIIGGTVCKYSTNIKHYFSVDDSLDIFAFHGMGGVVGLIGNGVFAADYITSLDGVNTTVPGGWIQHNWKQMYKQIVYIAAAMGYTFAMTVIIAKAFDLVPFLRLRADDASEKIGMDHADLGEFVQDFVEARRDFASWFLPSGRRGDGINFELSNWSNTGKVPVNLDKDYGPPMMEDGHIRHHRLALADEKHYQSRVGAEGEKYTRRHYYAY